MRFLLIILLGCFTCSAQVQRAAPFFAKRGAGGVPVSGNTLTWFDGVTTVVSNNPVGAVDLSNLGLVSVVADRCPNLTGLTLDANNYLATVTMTSCLSLTNFHFDGGDGGANMALTSLDFTGCGTHFNNLYVRLGGGLLSADFSAQTSFYEFDFALNFVCENVSVQNVTHANSIICSSGQWTSLNWTALGSVSNGFSVTDCPLMQNLETDAVESLGGGVLFYNNNSLTNISLPLATSTIGVSPVAGGSFDFGGCGNLLSVNIPAATIGTGGGYVFRAGNCTSLTNITLNANWPFPDSTVVIATACALPQSNVDSLIGKLFDTGGRMSTSLDTSEGTSATPGATALGQKAIINVSADEWDNSTVITN